MIKRNKQQAIGFPGRVGLIHVNYQERVHEGWRLIFCLIHGQDFIKGEVQRIFKEKDDENKDAGG